MFRTCRYTGPGCLTFLMLLVANSNAQDAAKTRLAQQAQTIFRTNCYECHQGPGSAGGDWNILNVKELTANSETSGKLITAGDPDKSPILRRMHKGLKKERGGMPPADSMARPGDKDVATIEAWIKAECPEAAPPPPPDRKWISTEKMLKSMWDYLSDTDKVEPEDLPYIRFFTLTHLHNQIKTVSDAELNLTRAALSEAINSLSWKPRLVWPKPVDEDKTVFAIDLRDLDWDKKGGQLWDEVAAAYPYGITYKDNRNQKLVTYDKNIAETTGTEISYVRADWFVAIALQPKLYHSLLKIPDTAMALEEKLGVSVLNNYRRNRMMRGGVTQSGVAVNKHNRLLERHDSLYGAYWKSYDFKQGNPLGNLKAYPLGPLNIFPVGKHPYEAQAFKHDGGELIFTLPNGLQGYMLVDGNDKRIDAGPQDVVEDRGLRPLGTGEIRNGLSCIACHNQGMKPFQDTIRLEAAGLRGKAERKMELLYSPVRTMSEVLDYDREKFQETLARATRPYLTIEQIKSKEHVDPVGAVARKYLADVINADTVATELGLNNFAALVLQLGNQGVKDIGLGALLLPNGTIRREEWHDGKPSLMQKVMRAAQLGSRVSVSAP